MFGEYGPTTFQGAGGQAAREQERMCPMRAEVTLADVPLADGLGDPSQLLPRLPCCLYGRSLSPALGQAEKPLKGFPLVAGRGLEPRTN